MQTTAIRYRVADFLKQHPPFHAMEEADLLALVSRGRVKFHEGQEFLCWQDASYAPLLFVIQQGSVSLWKSADGKEVLRDIRGPGDMIGVERFLGSTASPYSAKANGDVVVYALPAADFEPLLRKYPQAARYVEAYAGAGAVYRDAGREGVHQKFVVELAQHPEPLWCGPEDTIAEAARRMRGAGADAIAVMGEHAIEGVLTSADVVGWAADGGTASEVVKARMGAAPPAVAPQTRVSDCVLAMSALTMNGAGASVAALTADGTAAGGLLRLVSAADLQPAFGDNPLTLLREIASASDIEVVRVLHLRARAFLLAQLTEPATVDWLAALADRINVAVVKRLAELAGGACERWSWCFWGAAGRRETLTAAEPEIALLCEDEADVEQAREVLARVRADLKECGYLVRSAGEWDEEFACASTAAWQQRFARWVREPVVTQMYAARPLFDLRPVCSDAERWARVEAAVREAIGGRPSFQELLVNDCLSALPPLTFFEDDVVDEGGERSEVFALADRALGPIVDVARVFGIVHGSFLGSSTLERLERVRSRLPAEEAVFREAMETLRVLLYLQARTGLRLGSDGAEIAPAQLSRFDRQALKSGFRSIHELLKFAVKQLWGRPLEPRVF